MIVCSSKYSLSRCTLQYANNTVTRETKQTWIQKNNNSHHTSRGRRVKRGLLSAHYFDSLPHKEGQIQITSINFILQRGSKIFTLNVRDFRFISHCRQITRTITNCSKRYLLQNTVYDNNTLK